MKSAKLYSFGDIRIEDILVPKLGEKEVLIQTKFSGICSGDVMPWYVEKKAPLVLGHEPAGLVVQVGSRVKEFRPDIQEGSRVFVHHHAPCLNCNFCNRRDYVHCQTWKDSKIIPGGISEYILVPEINLKNDTLLLPQQISYEDGAMIEPIACVVKSLKRANIQKGDNVVIIGLGIMGQIHVMLAKYYGASRVICIDKIPFRINKALEIGADAVIDYSKLDANKVLNEITKGRMAQVVIVCPNNLTAMESAFDLISPGGSVVFFSPADPKDYLKLPINELYFKDISIINSYSCGPNDTKEALELIVKGVIKPERLITHRFTIDDTAKAYSLVIEAKDSLKVMIYF
ncbi:MAG TPA: zinc-binding dehydrogenase [Nitrospirae bacterium]|nr:zinc-binding dehydrogenase [Nitrospirota bacterium]